MVFLRWLIAAIFLVWSAASALAVTTTHTWTGYCTFGCTGYQRLTVSYTDGVYNGQMTMSAGLASRAGYADGAGWFDFSSDRVRLTDYDGTDVETYDGFQIYQQFYRHFSFDGAGTLLAWFERWWTWKYFDGRPDTYQNSNTRQLAAHGRWDITPPGLSLTPTPPAPVPLPAGAWLLLTALAMLGATRIRRPAAVPA